MWLLFCSVKTRNYELVKKLCSDPAMPGGSLFSFAEIADFELELEEAVIPLARERARAKRLEHRTLFLLRMGTIAEVAARRQCFNLGKSLLRSFTGNPDVELSHARRIN